MLINASNGKRYCLLPCNISGSKTLQIIFSYPSSSEAGWLSCWVVYKDQVITMCLHCSPLTVVPSVLRTGFAHRSECVLFPASCRCEPIRIICVFQVAGYPGNRTKWVVCGICKISHFHISDPVICKTLTTPETVRCELYEAIVFTRE